MSLIVDWTPQGRTTLRDLVAGFDGPVYISLVLFLIQAVASTDDASNQRLSFNVSTALTGTAQSTTPAIRGPQLPFELELIH